MDTTKERGTQVPLEQLPDSRLTATELALALASQPLTAAEKRERARIAELGGDVKLTPDGRLYKEAPVPTQAPTFMDLAGGTMD